MEALEITPEAREAARREIADNPINNTGCHVQLAINQATAKLEEENKSLKDQITQLQSGKYGIYWYVEEKRVLEERVRELERVVKAAYRLRFYAYIDWAKSGGLNQCGHGRAEGVHCPVCDEILLEGEGKTLP